MLCAWDVQQLLWTPSARAMAEEAAARGAPSPDVHAVAGVPALSTAHLTLLQAYSHPRSNGTGLDVSVFTAAFASASLSMCVRQHWQSISVDERWNLVSTLLEWLLGMLTTTESDDRREVQVWNPVVRAIAHGMLQQWHTDARFGTLLRKMIEQLQRATASLVGDVASAAETQRASENFRVLACLHEQLVLQLPGMLGQQTYGASFRLVISRDALIRPFFDIIVDCTVTLLRRIRASTAASGSQAVWAALRSLSDAVALTLQTDFTLSSVIDGDNDYDEGGDDVAGDAADADAAPRIMPHAWMVLRVPSRICAFVDAALDAVVIAEQLLSSELALPVSTATALFPVLLQVVAAGVRVGAAYAGTACSAWRPSTLQARSALLLQYSTRLMLVFWVLHGAPTEAGFQAVQSQWHSYRDALSDAYLETCQLSLRVASTLDAAMWRTEPCADPWLRTLFVFTQQSLALMFGERDAVFAKAAETLLATWRVILPEIALELEAACPAVPLARSLVRQLIDLLLMYLCRYPISEPTADDDEDLSMQHVQHALAELAVYRCNFALKLLIDAGESSLRQLSGLLRLQAAVADSSVRRLIAIISGCSTVLASMCDAVFVPVMGWAELQGDDDVAFVASEMSKSTFAWLAPALQTIAAERSLSLSVLCNAALHALPARHAVADEPPSEQQDRKLSWTGNPLFRSSSALSAGSEPFQSSIREIFMPSSRRLGVAELLAARQLSSMQALSPVHEAASEGAGPLDRDTGPMFTGSAGDDILSVASSTDYEKGRSGSNVFELGQLHTASWMFFMRLIATLRQWKRMREPAGRAPDVQDPAVAAITDLLMASLHVGESAVAVERPGELPAPMVPSDSTEPPWNSCRIVLERACMHCMPVFAIMYASARQDWQLASDPVPDVNASRSRFALQMGKLIPHLVAGLMPTDAEQDDILLEQATFMGAPRERSAPALPNVLQLVCDAVGAQHPSQVLDLVLAKVVDVIDDVALWKADSSVLLDALRFLRLCALGGDRLGRRNAGADAMVTPVHMFIPRAQSRPHQHAVQRFGEDMARTVAIRSLLAGRLAPLLSSMTAAHTLRHRSHLMETLCRLLFQHAHVATAPLRLLAAESGRSTAPAALPSYRVLVDGADAPADDSVDAFVFQPHGTESNAWFAQFMQPLAARAQELCSMMGVPDEPSARGVSGFLLCSSTVPVPDFPLPQATASRDAVVAFLRDLYGVVRAADHYDTFRMVHEWLLYHKVLALLYFIAVSYRADAVVLIPVARILLAYSRPDERRIMFPPSHTGPLVVEITVCRVCNAVLPHVLAQRSLLDPRWLKALVLFMSAAVQALTARFACLGIIESLGDTTPTHLWHQLVACTLQLPLALSVQHQKLMRMAAGVLFAFVRTPLLHSAAAALESKRTLRDMDGIALLGSAKPWQMDLAVPYPRTAVALCNAPPLAVLRILQRAMGCLRSNDEMQAAPAHALLRMLLVLEHECRYVMRCAAVAGGAFVHTPALLRIRVTEASSILSKLDIIARCPFEGTAVAVDLSGDDATPEAQGPFGVAWLLDLVAMSLQARSMPASRGGLIMQHGELFLLTARNRPKVFDAFLAHMQRTAAADAATSEQVMELLRDMAAEIEEVEQPTDPKHVEAYLPHFNRTITRIKGLTPYG